MATKTPQTPTPRRWANPSSRRSAPEQPANPPEHPASPFFSPCYKRRGLRPAVPFAPSPSSSDGVVAEPPSVDLSNWWLEEARGDGKIRIGGFKLHINQIFYSTPVVKRYNSWTLGTEAGFVVYLHGSLDISQMIENGYSSEACLQFVNGFPPLSWESRELLSPANTISQEERKAQFYFKVSQLDKNLDWAIKAVLNKHKSSSGDDSDHGILTKEKSAASNDHGSKGSPAVCSEVDSGKINLIVENTPEERDLGGTGLDILLAPTEEHSPISRPSTYVNQGCLERAQFIAVNEEVVPNEHISAPAHSDVQSLKNPIGSAEEQRSVKKVLQGATRSLRTRSPIPYAHNSPLTCAKANTLATPESLKLAKTRSGRVIVPKLDPGSQSIVYGKGGSILGVAGLELQSPLKGNKSGTPVARKRRAR